MEPKEFDIEFPRGDTPSLKFNLLDENKQLLELTNSDELYFTVKKGYGTSEFIFQKKYSNGDIQKDNDGYKVFIEHTDTASLNYGTYVFDISIKSGDYVATLAIGTITLTNEATHISNE